MPTASRKTPQRTARMLELHRAGSSAREIGEELGLSNHTIAAWLRDAGLAPNGGHGGRKVRPRREPSGAEAVIVAAKAELAEADVSGSTWGRPEAVGKLRDRLASVSALIRTMSDGIPGGTTAPQAFAVLVRLETDLAERIVALIPPEAPDPEKDPTNTEQAAIVRVRLQRLVEAAERVFRCAACGGDPYPRKTEAAR